MVGAPWLGVVVDGAGGEVLGAVELVGGGGVVVDGAVGVEGGGVVVGSAVAAGTGAVNAQITVLASRNAFAEGLLQDGRGLNGRVIVPPLLLGRS